MSLETKRIAEIIVFMKSFCFKIYINTSLHLPALHPSSRINSASGAYRVLRRLPFHSLCCTKARTEISSKSFGCILILPSFSETTVLFEKNDLQTFNVVDNAHVRYCIYVKMAISHLDVWIHMREEEMKLTLDPIAHCARTTETMTVSKLQKRNIA